MQLKGISENRILAIFKQKYIECLKTNKIFFRKTSLKQYVVIQKVYFKNLFIKTKDASQLKIKYGVKEI